MRRALRALVRCDEAPIPADLDARDWDGRLHLRHRTGERDINLRIENLSHACLSEVDDRAADLVRIAAYVYAADQSVGRGGPADVYGRNWPRELCLVIPVSDDGFWNQPAISGQFAETLHFLSDDTWYLVFRQGVPEDRQLVLNMNGPELLQHPNCVATFSGGADSLCALVEAVAGHGLKPVLVSHRSTPPVDARQRQLLSEVRSRLPQWAFPQISAWIHRRGGDAKENSQRTRGFLYASLAAAVAGQLGIETVFLADNGVVSINVPISEQLMGALVSRSTHPKFLHLFNGLLASVFPNRVVVENPLWSRTRSEVLSILTKYGCEELLQQTVSCAHNRGKTNVQPHCGVCSQCVDRRIGSLASGLADFDLAERYEVDIFIQELSEGPARTTAESYVRFAVDVHGRSEEGLFTEYAQLYDCLVPSDPDHGATGQQLAGMLKRHADQVLDVVRTQIATHSLAFVQGDIPTTSLLGLVTSRRHLQDPRAEAIDRLEQILRKGIPKIYQNRTPANEPELQQAVHGLLAGAEERLFREVPLLPFAGITTKPDFANLDNDIQGWLFIEMKYPKDRHRLREIVDEVNSKTKIYKQQGASALFSVYDPKRTITDDEQFAADLVDPGNIWIDVVR